jgi:hypothetical protein
MAGPTLSKTPEVSTPPEATPIYPRYQLHSRGCFIYPSGKRVECPDGTIVAENEKEQEYLALSAEAGCIYLVTEETAEAIAAKELNPHSDHV